LNRSIFELLYSLGLVLYELFEKKLPDYDRINGKVILPSNFQSSYVVLRCIDPVPERRPKASEITAVLDNIIENALLKIGTILSPHDTNLIVEDIKQIKQEIQDHSETELDVLYHFLLSRKTHQEIDQLLGQAFTPPSPISLPTQTPNLNPNGPTLQSQINPTLVSYSLPNQQPTTGNLSQSGTNSLPLTYSSDSMSLSQSTSLQSSSNQIQPMAVTYLDPHNLSQSAPNIPPAGVNRFPVSNAVSPQGYILPNNNPVSYVPTNLNIGYSLPNQPSGSIPQSGLTQPVRSQSHQPVLRNHSDYPPQYISTPVPPQSYTPPNNSYQAPQSYPMGGYTHPGYNNPQFMQMNPIPPPHGTPVPPVNYSPVPNYSYMQQNQGYGNKPYY